MSTSNADLKPTRRDRRAYMAKRHADRIDAGRCVDCNLPFHDGEHTRCPDCRYRRKLLSAGIVPEAA
jgi:hypothetical protein